jgi:geranylgeranyl reductase family protein
LQPDYEVIVVGSGPAGATIAYDLACRGVAVLVVDKAIFPRPKCCGGGITVRASKLLGPLPPDIVKDSIFHARFGSSGSVLLNGSSSNALVYTVNREEFDHFLLRRAENAGARILQGTAVTAVNATENGVEVMTPSGTLRSLFVIGADGSRSVVARCVGSVQHRRFIGIETEIQTTEEDLEKWQSRISIDVGWTPKGYAWVFPKQDHLSVGIGGPLPQSKLLKESYWKFLKSLNLSQYQLNSWSAGVVPMVAGKPIVVFNRVALLGDAAGLADPLTGEGIANAILSAHLAAPAIQSALEHGTCKLQNYQASVDAELTPEIETARFFARVIFSLPGKVLEFARYNERVWNAGSSLIRGERSYQSIKNRVGSLKGLFAILRGKA